MMKINDQIVCGVCEKPECIYWTMVELKMTEPMVKGTICHAHCVMCKHLDRLDLYTEGRFTDGN